MPVLVIHHALSKLQRIIAHGEVVEGRLLACCGSCGSKLWQHVSHPFAQIFKREGLTGKQLQLALCHTTTSYLCLLVLIGHESVDVDKPYSLWSHTTEGDVCTLTV